MPGTSPPEKDWIESIIHEFCLSDKNTLGPPFQEPAWEPPLIGYASGDDPCFDRLKKDIGPFYWTPLDAFRRGFPKVEATAKDLAVISYVLPQTSATRKNQGMASRYPARRWAHSRFYGEEFNCQLRCHLANTLSEAGFPAIAPERLDGFGYQESPRFGLASNWSERHTAWIAGLGTFGLSDGLITCAGKAVRFGSVVTKMDLPTTSRPYEGHLDWCLWYTQKTCGACMRRCPINAITESGHDKTACYNYIREVTAPYVRQNFGTDTTPCGLCQVNIPCENRLPLRG